MIFYHINGYKWQTADNNNVKKVLSSITTLAVILWILSANQNVSFAAHQNACILYTSGMNYYCEWEETEARCNDFLGKSYAGQKVIQVWFYYGRYCRELGFKPFSH